MEKLIDNVAADARSDIFFILSKSIWKSSKYGGYEVITSTNRNPRNFATYQSDGSYVIDSSVWDSVMEHFHR